MPNTETNVWFILSHMWKVDWVSKYGWECMRLIVTLLRNFGKRKLAFNQEDARAAAWCASILMICMCRCAYVRFDFLFLLPSSLDSLACVPTMAADLDLRLSSSCPAASNRAVRTPWTWASREPASLVDTASGSDRRTLGRSHLLGSYLQLASVGLMHDSVHALHACTSTMDETWPQPLRPCFFFFFCL